MKYKANALKIEASQIKQYIEKNKKIPKACTLSTGETLSPYSVAYLLSLAAKDNAKSVIVYWPEYLRSLKTSFGSSNDEFKNKYNELKYAKLLLIDDLGAEGVTSWSRDEVLGTILQYRMQEELPTFITSNLNIKELEDHLSVTTSNKSEKVKAKRIVERIKQLTTDIEMLGENKRK